MNIGFAQSTASGQVSTFSLDAPQLGVAKKIWVYLPKGYEASSKKYPVLYMHDAQNVFDASTSFVGEWNVDETLDSLNAQVIVIGIEHGNDKRIDELTPFKNAKYGGGKADSYLEFIVSSLKPEVDRRYRTKTSSKDTGIMGSSLGGLVSFYAALKYPDVFGKVGVFSPSFWFSNEIYAFADIKKVARKRFYFMCGTKEDTTMVDDMRKMSQIVRKNGAEAVDNVIEGGEHNEKLWRSQFAKAFLWLYR